LGLGNYRPIGTPLLLQRVYCTSSDDSNNNNNKGNKKNKQSPAPVVEAASKKPPTTSNEESTDNTSPSPAAAKKKHDANGFPSQVVILPLFSDVAFPGLSPLFLFIRSILNIYIFGEGVRMTRVEERERGYSELVLIIMT
jgi:hypothetical protein